MTGFPCLEKRLGGDGQLRYRLGHPLVDRYLEFVAGRARPNTLRATRSQPRRRASSSAKSIAARPWPRNPAASDCTRSERQERSDSWFQGGKIAAPLLIVTTLSTNGPDWADAAANAVALQPDGKIVAAGSSAFAGQTGGELALARYYGTQELLTVTKSGTGAGTVASNPAGISCGHVCTHAYDGYDGGTSIRLKAVPARGSSFASWSGGGCSGIGTCDVTMDEAQTVTATFALKPACIAPRAKGKSLTVARRMIKRAHCRTGHVKHSFSNVKKNHVISQTPGHGRHLLNDAKINLRVSKGKRH